jgi:hypothetical protein
MKTAVEWLKEIYDSCNTYEKFISNIDWEQAKEMDKAERAKEYLNGFKDGKEYMKKIQTFKSE